MVASGGVIADELAHHELLMLAYRNLMLGLFRFLNNRGRVQRTNVCKIFLNVRKRSVCETLFFKLFKTPKNVEIRSLVAENELFKLLNLNWIFRVFL